MSLVLKLASRNLFQDRLRFVTTVIGIVFSIILVLIQMGLFLSFERMVTTMIDHVQTDLWIVPFGTRCFEDPSLVDEHARAQALAVQGVTEVNPLVVGFTDWAVPSGGMTPVFVVGSTVSAEGLHPWNIVKGNLAALSMPHAVAVDRTYFDRLGVTRIGDSTEIREQKAEVTAITNGIRSFTTTPYVFTSLDRAQAYMAIPPNKVSYFLVHVAPNTDIDSVRQQLLAHLAKVEVLTPDEFRRRSRAFWLFGTGAGPPCSRVRCSAPSSVRSLSPRHCIPARRTICANSRRCARLAHQTGIFTKSSSARHCSVRSSASHWLPASA